jgi:DNA-binding IscR family transcriptional regulator
MSIPTKSDIISAITVYTAANKRPCPIDHLIEKFGSKKLVQKLVNDLKEANAIVGRRGRTGGLTFPEDIAIDATPIETASVNDEHQKDDANDGDNTDNENATEQDGMKIVEIPF